MSDEPSPQLAIAVEDHGSEVVVFVSGELDLINADRLGEALEALLDRESLDTLVLDLAGLSFMDSSGLAVMLRAAGRTKILLRSPSELIREVVTATGLGSVLRIGP